MPTQNISVGSESRPRYWLRVLRPLLWWTLLVLMLYGIRTHQRLLQQTRLNFTVSLAGRPTGFETAGTLDGKPAYEGQLISLGRHELSVTHPKGVSFTTNLFTWYGGHNLGAIDLPRKKGALTLTIEPPAPLLTIRGPEFNVTLTNSSGVSNSVPTDQYWVEVRYRHWEQNSEVVVAENRTSALTVTPKFGVLKLACNQSDATFKLVRVNDEYVEAGEFPSTIGALPEGTYKLTAWHHNHRWDERPEVKGGAINDLQIKFEYGSAILETKPPGALVTSADGQDWGVTPLNLKELQRGTWKFALRLDNYEPVTISLNIAANETTTVRSNLVSQSYSGAMRAARKFMADLNYDQAVEALREALRLQPDDAAADSLHREAIALGGIRRAEELGNRGDYIAGIRELTAALAALPDNDRAKLLLADFKKHEPEQREKMRVERLNRPKTAFETRLSRIAFSDLFDTHEFKSPKPYKDVETAIFNAFQNGKPEFKVSRHPSPEPETFHIDVVQEFSTVLATSAGRRQCVIVGGQTKDDETQIFCKILETKAEAVNKFSIGAWIGTPMEVSYVPIHPSRIGALTEKLQLRVKEGVSNVTARIQGALGQTPTELPTALK